jgi:hypothetical protein
MRNFAEKLENYEHSCEKEKQKSLINKLKEIMSCQN